MYEIIPGILEKEWSEIERKIELVRPFAKTIHIDIIDGKFAPNTTFSDPTPFKKYVNDVFLELHMMVDNPTQYLKPFAASGFKRFLGHIEKMPDVAEFVAQGQLLGEVGLAIDGPTSIDSLTISLDDLDTILIMTINAGFSGQGFTPSHLDKVKAIRQKSASIQIEVDGGVNDQTIALAKDSGAERFVANSFLFNSDHPEEQYKKLLRILSYSKVGP